MFFIRILYLEIAFFAIYGLDVSGYGDKETINN